MFFRQIIEGMFIINLFGSACSPRAAQSGVEVVVRDSELLSIAKPVKRDVIKGAKR